MKMITKKLWNSFHPKTREDILSHINWVTDYIKQDLIKNPYKHNFDFDNTGKFLKTVLDVCNLQKDGTINITVSIKPYYCEVNKQDTTEKLYKWIISYISTDGDGTNVWTMARDKQEAESIIQREYWDIKKIISIRKE